MNLHLPQAVFLTCLISYLLIRIVYQKRATVSTTTATRSNTLDRVLVRLVVIGQIVLPLLYLFSPWLNFASYESFDFACGFGLLTWLAGLWVFWRSHADLGTNWSVSLGVRAGHQLVTHGIYRYTRHPMYSAFLLFGFAQIFLLPNWLAGGAALISVGLMCLVRIPQEEAMMCEFFGQEYRDYMQLTGSVFPRIGVAVRMAGR